MEQLKGMKQQEAGSSGSRKAEECSPWECVCCCAASECLCVCVGVHSGCASCCPKTGFIHLMCNHLINMLIVASRQFSLVSAPTSPSFPSFTGTRGSAGDALISSPCPLHSLSKSSNIVRLSFLICSPLRFLSLLGHSFVQCPSCLQIAH